jgi:hypothetical protein
MKAVVAENLLLMQQLFVLTRSRKRTRIVKKLKLILTREIFKDFQGWLFG